MATCLEPLNGYLTLAEQLYRRGPEFAGPWNFGPEDADLKSVEWIVSKICEKWGEDSSYAIDAGSHPMSRDI